MPASRARQGSQAREAARRGVPGNCTMDLRSTTLQSTQFVEPTVRAMLEKSSKSLESWIWDAACYIRGAKDAPKFKDFILPLIFSKRLCDVFDDEIDRIAKEVGSRAKAFRLVKHDKKLVRFYLPLQPNNPDDRVWSVIRTLSDKNRRTTHDAPARNRRRYTSFSRPFNKTCSASGSRRRVVWMESAISCCASSTTRP